jgi:hypothetical protein
VKQIFTILLAFWMLLGGFMPHSDVEELVKIPALIDHYFEHKAKDNPSLTFLEFIHSHYSENCDHQKGHENLPFMKHSMPCLVYLIPQFSVQFVPTFEILVAVTIPYQFSCSSDFSAASWQPPRLV